MSDMLISASCSNWEVDCLKDELMPAWVTLLTAQLITFTLYHFPSRTLPSICASHIIVLWFWHKSIGLGITQVIMAPIVLDETCLMCPRRGTKKCTGCKQAQYCSRGKQKPCRSVFKLTRPPECQALDWKVHKMLCSSLSDPKPGPEYRRIIHFPDDEEIPKFSWMKVWEVPDKRESFDEWDREPYFRGQTTERCDLACNHVQARDVRRNDHDAVRLWMTSEAMMLPCNTSIRAVTRAGAASLHWRGPVVAIRTAGRDPAHEWCVDIEMRDVRNVADFLTFAWRGAGKENSHMRVIACAKSSTSMVDAGNLKYTELALDHSNTVFCHRGSAIANLLGIPLLIEKAVAGNCEGQPGMTMNSRNPLIEILKRDLNSTTTGPQRTAEEIAQRQKIFDLLGERTLEASDQRRFEFGQNGFGSSPQEWNSPPVGLACVVRADGKPLFKEHLEAICEYAKQKVEPRLQAAVDGLSSGSVATDRENVLNSVTKSDFVGFWNTYSAARGADVPQWLIVPSPYDLKGSVLDTANRAMEDLLARQAEAGFPPGSLP